MRSDRDLVARFVRRVVIETDRITVELLDDHGGVRRPDSPGTIHLRFSPNGPIRKGIDRAPQAGNAIDPREREVLLQAIARARGWVDAVLTNRADSFEAIAACEAIGERHVRRIAPLAFLSPRIIQAIADGMAPSGLTVSSLTLSLPYGWAAQERMIGLG
jgi:site-specific DNA recombinase